MVEVFDRIRTLPGWFNADDCAHFHLILSMQSLNGLHGDLLEIGSYHGRSAGVLAASLQPGERLVVCDAFEAPVDDPYPTVCTPERLWSNLVRVVPALDRNAVEIHACWSHQLDLPAEPRFRFAHVDGGHRKEDALYDLRLSAERLLPGGVMAVDDYRHYRYPGVTEAVDTFLYERGEFSVLADLNRRGAIGRKIYLHRQAD
jgi:predicted O-methyltransferase YrrM